MLRAASSPSPSILAARSPSTSLSARLALAAYLIDKPVACRPRTVLRTISARALLTSCMPCSPSTVLSDRISDASGPATRKASGRRLQSPALEPYRLRMVVPRG
ncbi:Uncharacterised protein [Bordetella pertussis]|nr:Uncharacterised protein [Bordetella pertussis]